MTLSFNQQNVQNSALSRQLLGDGMATHASLKPRKADHAYSRLKQLILTLELRPGQSLDEAVLMDMLDVGRTPLREAMQRLGHERLIHIAPRKGSWVAELSFTELQEMLEARRFVEPGVAAMAVSRLTDENIAHFREIVTVASEAMKRGDILEAVSRDLQFHRELAQASGNGYLARMVDQINTAMLRYWFVSFEMIRRASPAFSHHQIVVDELANGDPEAVARVMSEHIEIFSERMRQALLPS